MNLINQASGHMLMNRVYSVTAPANAELQAWPPEMRIRRVPIPDKTHQWCAVGNTP
jgi:hypothetical protein